MKIRIVLFSIFSTLTCLSAAYAGFEPQLYVGAQGGYADTNFNLSTVMLNPQTANGSGPLTSANIKNHVFGARGYGGYQFNQYFALEAGYLRVRSTRYTNINQGTQPDGDITQYAVDGRGKLFLPMAAYIHLSPYFQFGIAYMNATTHGGITSSSANGFGYTWHPILGAGIGYEIYPHITADLSWASYFKRNSEVPRVDTYFFGLTYHFALQDTKSGAPNYGDVNNEDP